MQLKRNYYVFSTLENIFAESWKKQVGQGVFKNILIKISPIPLLASDKPNRL